MLLPSATPLSPTPCDDFSIDELVLNVELTVDLLGDLSIVAETKRDAANFFLADDIANAFCFADTLDVVAVVVVVADEDILPLIVLVVEGLTGVFCVLVAGREAFVVVVVDCNIDLFFVTEVSLTINCSLLSAI